MISEIKANEVFFMGQILTVCLKKPPQFPNKQVKSGIVCLENLSIENSFLKVNLLVLLYEAYCMHKVYTENLLFQLFVILRLFNGGICYFLKK